ncbi:MAG: monofunctional biosynthetic peptidoglycan transglycosylase [Desulfobacterales bacterium]|nr:monofunctional biosynthetic peptidoglycan transglycosylase [Desulfobacterales bacterium]
MRRVLKWGLKIFFVLWLLTLVQVFLLRFINPPFTVGMFTTWVQNRGPTSNWRLRNSWRSLKEISPHLRKAVLAGEDQRFLSHHGFDFTEMNEAIKDMASRKGFRGASTITMQMARTVYLWPERSWLRKGAEAYYTLVIEILWTKERILEIYLNTVDWGTGLMGVEAASQKYFHKPCLHLSPSQAAALAAILPSPHRWSPTRPNSRVLDRKKRIMKDMKKMPLI